MFEFFEKIAEGIGFKLVNDFSNKVIGFIKEIKVKADNSQDDNDIATSGDDSQVATSGYNSKVATSGNYSKVATSGDDSKVATSGDDSQVATSGYNSKVATSGNYSKVATSGDDSQVATSGYNSKVATSGNYSKVATSGDDSKVATSGDDSQVATSGYNSKVATSGNYSKVATSGDDSQVATSGDDSQVATSGYNSKVEISGNNSVGFVCGLDSIIKAKKGTWISLCEYRKDEETEKWVPEFAMSAQIGNKDYKDVRGRILKETEFYTLHNKKFYPIDFSDGIKTMKISAKVRDGMTIIKGIDFDEYDEVYVVKQDDLSAHGETLKEALEDLQYKKIQSEEVQAIVEEIKKTKKVNKAQYRAITGACQYGTNKFCEEHNITAEEISLDELRKILINDYGAEKFWSLIES